MYENKIHVGKKQRSGLHTAVSRVPGRRQAESKERIRVATCFATRRNRFYFVIVVQTSAPEGEEHNKAFYQLCCHMEPQYHQLEFDTRLWP